MEIALEEILPKLDAWLEDEDIDSFIIGVTDDIQRRDIQYANRQLIAVAESADSHKICQAEIDLIDYYKAHQTLGEKCRNKNRGGGGQTKGVTTVYFAIGYSNPTVDDLWGTFINIDLPVKI